MSYDVDSLIKKFTLYGNAVGANQVSPMKSHQFDNEPPSGGRYYQETSKRPSDFVTRFNDSSLIMRSMLPQQASFDQSNLNKRKAASNHNGSNTHLSYKANSFQLSQNKTCSTSRNGLNENSNYHYNPLYNTFQDHIELRDDSSVPPSSARGLNNLGENEKSKFFNTLKSLFAIFDPECKGSIDLNELEKLGSNKNEILNEVVDYLRKRNECFSPRANKNVSVNSMGFTNKSTEHLSYRVATSNSNARVSEFERPKFFVAQSPQRTHHSSNHKSMSQSDFASPNSLVTFDEFVKAAELILDKRKMNKMQNQKQVKTKSSENNEDLSDMTNSNNEDLSYYSNSASSTTSSPSSTSSHRKSNTQSSSQQYNQPSSNDDLSDGDRDHVPLSKLTDKTNLMVKSPPKANSRAPLSYYNSFDSPSTEKKAYASSKVSNHNKGSSMTTSSLSSASSNMLVSASSASATSSSSSIDMTTANTKTLSQAFDESAVFSNDGAHRPASKTRGPHVSLSGVATISSSKGANSSNAKSERTSGDGQNRIIKVSTNFNLSNANSCDLSGLIDKENYLLKEGLNEIEAIRNHYMNQLKENQQKQNNITRLKHQNLFGIDKMLMDLKQLNDLNMILKDFMAKNAKPDMDSPSESQVLSPKKPAKTETKSVHFSTTKQESQQQLPPPPPPPPMQQPPSMASQPPSSATQSSNTTSSNGQSATVNFYSMNVSTGPTGSSNNSNASLPKYKEYIEQLDLYKNEADLDNYLKEKQDRIEALQKEKSMLIRKLFEMKSTAATLKDKSNHSSETTNGKVSSSGSSQTPAETPTSPLFNTTICQLIETPKTNNPRNYENLSYRSPTSSSTQHQSANETMTASYRTPTAAASQYNQQHHKPIYQSAQLPKQQSHQKQLRFNDSDQPMASQTNRTYMNHKFI